MPVRCGGMNAMLLLLRRVENERRGEEQCGLIFHFFRVVCIYFLFSLLSIYLYPFIRSHRHHHHHATSVGRLDDGWCKVGWLFG